MIKDRNIGYSYKREFIPVTSFNTFDGKRSGTSAASVLIDSLIGSSLVEIGALGVVGLKQITAGHEARMLMPLPVYWDVDNDIFMRVLWSDEGTSDSLITYSVKYKQFRFGAAPAAADQPLDSLIAADAHGEIANGINATTWGKMDAGSLSRDNDFLVIDVEMTTEGADLDPVLVGLEIAYLPKLTSGAQNKLTSDPEDA
jgi:hypothetical protein